MKKIISLLSAIAMIASLAVSASAAPEIQLSLDFAATGEKLSDENYDPDLNFEDYYEAPVYKVELSIKGVSKKASVKENGTTVAYTGCIVDSIQTKLAYEAEKDIICVGSSLISGALSKTTVPGELTFSWSTATSAEMLKAEAVIGTWYFVAEDMGEIADMKVGGFPGYAHIGQINQYWDGTSKTETLKLAPFTPVIVAYPAVVEPEPDPEPAPVVMEEAVAGNEMQGSDGLMWKTALTKISFKGVENPVVKLAKDSVPSGKKYELPADVKGGTTDIIGIIRYPAGEKGTFVLSVFDGETSETSIASTTYVAE